jgi:hypothetical protein
MIDSKKKGDSKEHNNRINSPQQQNRKVINIIRDRENNGKPSPNIGVHEKNFSQPKKLKEASANSNNSLHKVTDQKIEKISNQAVLVTEYNLNLKPTSEEIPKTKEKDKGKGRANSQIPSIKLENSNIPNIPKTPQKQTLEPSNDDFLSIFNDLKRNIKNFDLSRKQIQQNILSKLNTVNTASSTEISTQISSPVKLHKVADSLPCSPQPNKKLKISQSPAKEKKTALNFKLKNDIKIPIYEDETEERRVSLCIINNEGNIYN